MEGVPCVKRSDSGSGKMALLLRTGSTKEEKESCGEAARPVMEDLPFEELALSMRVVRSVSAKWKRKKEKTGMGNNDNNAKVRDESNGEDGTEKMVHSSCLCLYGRAGGCKVGADTAAADDFNDGCGNNRRKTNAGEDCLSYRVISGFEEAKMDCFSYAVADWLWRRNGRKLKEIEQGPPVNRNNQFTLPDDLLEMCLVRLPLTSLMTARLVCKKWRALTTAPHFLELRLRGSYQSPWMYVFGVVKDGVCSGHMHALDVSLDHWHRIGSDMLRGRFLFSVAGVGSEIYIVGGCSSLSNFGRVDRTSFKTHKSVIVFSPLNGLWRKVASMRTARSGAILGFLEVNSFSIVFQARRDWQRQRTSRTRIGGVSEVYEDPHMFSIRRQLTDASSDVAHSSESRRKSFKIVKQENNHMNRKGDKRFVLIAVGGQGPWEEPLDTGEIYDPVSNKWLEIAKLPGDFGRVCSGAVCAGKFYACSETNKLAAYDVERDVWTGIQTTSFPPRILEYLPNLLSCSDRLFLFSVSWCRRDGDPNRRDKAVRKLWELDPTYLTWSEISEHPDAPMDWNAVFMADRGNIFGVEMFKIFGQVLDFVTVCDINESSELNWVRASKKHIANYMDASSCVTKSVAVLYL